MSDCNFIETLSSRGFLHQISDKSGLSSHLRSSMVSGYIGFDCTALSLHIGNLLGIMMLRWLQKSGHRPIVLLGGTTTKIGDPSGKEESRRMLSAEDIEANKSSIKKVFANFLTFDNGENKALILDNDSWLSKLNYIDFLRNYGIHFSVNRMLAMDSVRIRLDREQNLSFLEFNYMLLQSYDFFHLYRNYDCILQMGGSDQWGNIVSGIDFTRRVTNAGLYGVTCPLLTTSSGAKMGKTAQGAVWLDSNLLSVHDYWQFWRNTKDKDVGKFLRLFTDIPVEEIKILENLEASDLNEAKIKLANAATELAHGGVAARKAAETARITFEEGKLADNLPTYHLDSNELEKGIGLLTILVRVGFCKSNGEARRHIKNRAIRLNDELIENVEFRFFLKSFNKDSIKLSLGKKKHYRLTISSQ